MECQRRAEIGNRPATAHLGEQRAIGDRPRDPVRHDTEAALNVSPVQHAVSPSILSSSAASSRVGAARAANAAGCTCSSSTRACFATALPGSTRRLEEHTSELQSLMRIPYAVFCLKKKKTVNNRL